MPEQEQTLSLPSLLDQMTEPQLEDDAAPVVEEKAPEPEAEAPKTVEEVINILEPLAEPAVVTLSFKGRSMGYVQAPLSYFGKMEFMGLLGKTLDSAIKDGLSVSTIFGAVEDTPSVSDLNASDFQDLESFLALVSKIAGYAPDFLRECYLIWLRIPKNERSWAREALESLEDDQGLEIIERFIDQNWDAVETFLTEHLPRVVKRVAEKRQSN